MGCASCSSANGGKPAGCGSKGSSCNGGCNRMNTFDWLTLMDIEDSEPFQMVEVSFKNGARKDFYHNPSYSKATTGDMVVVECSTGYDIGRVNLSGELVRLQMKKKRVPENGIFQSIIRKANERDLEKLVEARELELPAMVKAKAIARTLGLDMKIGDVEYQGDKRKATFFYTADGRVDFRELIRHYAKEFKVKIEMRQIGARQESARIGGIGSCGRELCCSTWLSDFKSVTTSAARYQNLAINQSKLSGQCGRLKCCLNYELDTYMDALENFPKNNAKLYLKKGVLMLVKADIFKGTLLYSLNTGDGNGKLVTLDIDQVNDLIEMNAQGEKPEDLLALQIVTGDVDEDGDIDFESVSDVIEDLPAEKRRKRKRNRNRNRRKKPSNAGNANANKTSDNKDSTKKKTNNNNPNSNKNSNDSNENKRNNKNNKRKRPPSKNRNKPPQKDK